MEYGDPSIWSPSIDPQNASWSQYNVAKHAKSKNGDTVKINIIDHGDDCHLVFEGPMTHEFSRQMENQVINLMRRYQSLKIDLSQVSEIDLFGIHLLAVLRHVGGKSVDIIAASPIVDRAVASLPSTSRGTSLGHLTRHHEIRQSENA